MIIVSFNIEDQIAIHQFNELAISLYENEKGQYAAQANQISKALFVKGFMVMHGQSIMARGILYDANINLDGKPVIYFGNFEARDSHSGALLFDAMIVYSRLHYPLHQLIGPVNGSTWNDYRIATAHFPVLFPNDICSGNFYHQLLLGKGFEILHRYFTNLQTELNQKRKFISPDFTPVFFSKEKFEKKLHEIYQLTMEAFEHAVLFSPLSEKQFIGKQMHLLPYLDMELLPFVLDKEEAIVGYAFCYIGFEQDSLIVKTIARKKGRMYAGIGRILSTQIIDLAQEKGFKKIYHAFMHESNHSNNLSVNLYGERIKTYALYKLK